MYRTKTCGELRLANLGERVTLAGWVQSIHNLGALTFVDLRDRYGITQLAFNEDASEELRQKAGRLGREFVVQATGQVIERHSKNHNIPTGEIEILVEEMVILNESLVPPFTIEENTDGGDDLRMKYRYLDLRRACVRKNLELRHRFAFEVRRYLDQQGFLEIETPVLVNSTPEGARDFVVPSRMNKGQFYALPQSPQILKQLLMVSGMDRYFQIVKCFRDEDLRADRQPEFTQIDCEMSFVEQEDVLQMFEGMARHLFHTIKGIDLPQLPRMTWADAMKYYGSDKPDTRFGMRFVELKNQQPDNASRVLVDSIFPAGFSVFDDAAYIGAICCEGQAVYTRKQLDQLTDFVKRPQVGAKGLVYARVQEDGSVKSSVDKFYSHDTLVQLRDRMEAKAGDLITHQKDKAVLTLLKIDNLVEKDFKEVHPEMSLKEMVDVISISNRNLFPVTDAEGKLKGIVLLDDIRNIMFRTDLYRKMHVSRFMSAVPDTIKIDQRMDKVMETFDKTNAWNLPVVDQDGHYLGFVSKSKIFNSYRQVLKHFTDD